MIYDSIYSKHELPTATKVHDSCGHSNMFTCNLDIVGIAAEGGLRMQVSAGQQRLKHWTVVSGVARLHVMLVVLGTELEMEKRESESIELGT